MFGQFQGRERLLNIGFHKRNSLHQALRRMPQAATQRHMLALICQANAVTDKLLRHLLRQAGTVMLTNQREHQIHGRGSPRAGQPVAINLKQLLRKCHLRIGLRKSLKTLPGQRRTIAFKQPTARQHFRAPCQPTQCHTAPLVPT